MDLDQQWATKPLLLAAQRLGIVPTSAVYIGDDLRDIEAGKAAGMLAVAAAYGYCGSDVALSNWGADHVVETTTELQRLFGGHVAVTRTRCTGRARYLCWARPLLVLGAPVI
jgi:phosphoglycolate phosphatase